MQPLVLRRVSAHLTVAALVVGLFTAAAVPAAAETVCVKRNGEYIACVTP